MFRFAKVPEDVAHSGQPDKEDSGSGSGSSSESSSETDDSEDERARKLVILQEQVKLKIWVKKQTMKFPHVELLM